MSESLGRFSRGRVLFTTILGILAEFINKLTPIALVRLGQNSLGLEAYGFTQYGFYLVEVCLPLVLFGYTLKNIFTCQTAMRSGETGLIQRKVGEIIVLRSLHGIVAIIGACAFLLNGNTDFTLKAIFVVALFFGVMDLSFIQFAFQKLHFLSTAGIFSKIVSLILVFFLVKTPDDKYIFLAAILGSNSLVSIATFIYGTRRFKPIWPNAAALKTAFITSLPHGIFVIASGVAERLDFMLLERNLGQTALGIYAGVSKLHQSLLPVIYLLSNIFFAESLTVDKIEEEQNVLKLTLRCLMTIVTPVCFGIWFVSHDSVNLVLGPAFLAGVPSLNILVSSLFFQAWIFIFSFQVFIKETHIKGFAAYSLLFTPALFFLYPTLIQHWGLEGLAWGVFGYKATYALGLWLWVFFMMNFRGSEAFFGFVPGCIMAGGLWLIGPLPLPLTLIAGALLYGMGMYLCHKKEALHLIALLRRSRSQS